MSRFNVKKVAVLGAGVLDIDSDTPAAFTTADEEWLVPLLAEVFHGAR